MGLDDGVGEVGVRCGGRLGVRRLEVGPCGGVRREEVDKSSAYFTPSFRPIRKEECLVVRWGEGEDLVRAEACFAGSEGRVSGRGRR